MKQRKNILSCIFLIFAVALIITFIFANSFLDFSASHKLSGFIMKWLFGNVNETNGVVEDYWLRKTAHLVEYALLGAAFGGVITFFRRQYNKYIIGMSLFALLAIAVTDEFIQSFSDRTSSVFDVMLDFGGAFIGLGLFILFVWIIKRAKAKKQ